MDGLGIAKHEHTFLSHFALAFAQCTQAMGILSTDASIFGHEANRERRSRLACLKILSPAVSPCRAIDY